MASRNYLTYSLIRCADDRRDEALNVGVLVLDSEARRIAVRIAGDLGRVRRALPNVRIEHLEEYLKGLPDLFARRAPELTPEGLNELAAEWSNGVRLSGTRTISGDSAEAAADALFARCVALDQPPEEGLAVPPEVSMMAASSKRTIRSVVSRLRKRGFEPGEDFETDAKVIGLTAKDTAVPVWFPVRVRGHMLIDSLEVRPKDERRTIDDARLIAAKTDEVLRVNGHSVAVVIREGPSDLLNELVSSLLLEEGAVGSREPSLHWYRDLDRFVSNIPKGQFELPSSETNGNGQVG